jgi:ubiquitin-like 1-activating enzyme E1 A
MEIEPALTAEEAALYDRQLRLWGVEAQQRLGQAKVLLIGFTAVQSEICKNIVLAGVRTVTINDTHECTLEDTEAHLFLTHDCLGQNVVQPAMISSNTSESRSGFGRS